MVLKGKVLNNGPSDGPFPRYGTQSVSFKMFQDFVKSGKLVLLKDENEEFIKTEDLEGHASTVNQVRFNQKNLMATCGDDNTVKVFSFK